MLLFLFLIKEEKQGFSVNYIIILQHTCVGLRETQIETEESFEAEHKKILFSFKTSLTLSGSDLNGGCHGHI